VVRVGEQAQRTLGQPGGVVALDHPSGPLVLDDVTDAARIGGDDGHAGREGIEDGARKAVEVRAVEVDVGALVELGHLRGCHLAAEVHVAKPEIVDPLQDLLAQRAVAGDDEPRLRHLGLDAPERLQRAGIVVERLEEPVDQEHRPQRVANPIVQPLDVQVVRDHLGAQAELRVHAGQVRRGRHDPRRHAHGAHGDRSPAPQVVLELAAAIVQDDLLPVEPPDEDGEHGAQEVRPVRGGEDVDDVVPGQPYQQEADVGDGVHHGANEAHALQPAERSGQCRVVRDEPHRHIRNGAQVVHEALCLDRLPAEDAQRRSDDADPEGAARPRRPRPRREGRSRLVGHGGSYRIGHERRCRLEGRGAAAFGAGARRRVSAV
jgi:hypothetical protein